MIRLRAHQRGSLPLGSVIHGFLILLELQNQMAECCIYACDSSFRGVVILAVTNLLQTVTEIRLRIAHSAVSVVDSPVAPVAPSCCCHLRLTLPCFRCHLRLFSVAALLFCVALHDTLLVQDAARLKALLAR